MSVARTLSIAELATTVFDGPFGSNLKSNDYTPSGVRVVRLENIGHRRFIAEKTSFISNEKAAGLARHRLLPGDVLFSSFVEDVVRVCLFPAGLPTPAINKADCFCIRVNPNLALPEFVALRLASPETFKVLRDLVHGATRPRVGLQGLKNYRIEVPPLAEQRRIVARIEALFARTRRARADLERIAPLCKKHSSTSVAALLTAGMGAGWNPLPLGSFSLEVRNGIATKPFAEPPGLPILRISAVRAGSVALRDSRFHRPSGTGNEHNYLLRNRDLLFIRFNGNSELVAACGMVRGLDGPCVYPDKLIRVRLDESRALPEFVEIAMSSASARDQLSRFIKTAAGQHGISGADLKSIVIPLPRMTTQLEIVQTAARTRPVLKLAAREATRAVALLDRLEASILARAFRGELVAQDPSDLANPPAILPAPPATRRRARALA